MRPNSKIQNLIIKIMGDLWEMKETFPNDDGWAIIPDFDVKFRRGEFVGFPEIVPKLPCKPKEMIRKASEFVESVEKKHLVDYFDRAVRYSIRETEYCEVGCIWLLKTLLAKTQDAKR